MWIYDFGPSLYRSLTENLECAWCPSTNRCSSGIDRLREKWLIESCHEVNVTKPEKCFPRLSSSKQLPLKRQHQFYNSTIILVTS